MSMHFGEYDSPLYRQAVQQFDEVKERTGVGAEHLERLRFPKRAVMVTVPVRMDDDSVVNYFGYRVQHSLTSGPGKGGLRYHPAVDLGEVSGLAMLMSWKCGLMGLPFGGAKGGINCDPTKMSIGEIERLTRRFTQEMIPFIGPMVDVLAPDLGTNEQVMAWIYDTYSVHIGQNVPQIVTGKSTMLYGTVGRREATGRGVVYCIEEAAGRIGLKMSGAKAAVQGFGNVGSITALELAKRGVKVIALADVFGAIHNPKGINVEKAIQHVESRKPLDSFPGAESIPKDEVLTQKCDILVPAAIERVITKDNVDRINCRILAEGANGPTTNEADQVLRKRKDLILIPDILCNAGGVVVSYFEWVQDIQMFFWSEDEVNRRLKEIILKSFHGCYEYSKQNKVDMRTAALVLGIRRIAREKAHRGLYP